MLWEMKNICVHIITLYEIEREMENQRVANFDRQSMKQHANKQQEGKEKAGSHQITK